MDRPQGSACAPGDHAGLVRVARLTVALEHPAIDPLVAGAHHRQVEVRRDARAARVRVQFVGAGDRRRQILEVVDDDPGAAIVDDLRDRATPGRHDRCAAGHRLDHHHAERLIPRDREHQAGRPRIQLALERGIRLPDIFRVRAQQRTHLTVEVLLLGRLVELAGEDDAASRAPCRLDRGVGALIGAESPHPQHVALLRLAEGKAAQVDRVVDVAHPIQVGCGGPLGTRDRHQVDGGAQAGEVVAVVAAGRSVDRRERRDVAAPGEQRSREGVVVHQIELESLDRLRGLGGMNNLRHRRRAELLGGRCRVGGDVARRPRPGIARGDERHVVAALHEVVDEAGHDGFGSAIAGGRKSEPRRCDHADSDWTLRGPPRAADRGDSGSGHATPPRGRGRRGDLRGPTRDGPRSPDDRGAEVAPASRLRGGP